MKTSSIKITVGRTINIGNYESVKVEITEEITNIVDRDKSYQELTSAVVKKLSAISNKVAVKYQNTEEE